MAGILGLACLAAQAADWRSIGGTDVSELSIDAESVQQVGALRQAWSMWNFKEARQNNDSSFPSLKSYQDLYLYNCKDQTLRLSKEIIFADNNGMGDKRDHSDALKGTTFDKPAPGSVAEIMLKEVCAAPLAKTADKAAVKKKK
ncbi:transcriptional regulator [Oxalobacteraceae bacterium CAVE-383]|nr:transcriptional regulator [Oxalobacteraceae bacterium CAVE-383]